MNQPTVTEAYAMIRVLKKRALKGDADKIAGLEKIISDDRDRKAQLAIDKYFK